MEKPKLNFPIWVIILIWGTSVLFAQNLKPFENENKSISNGKKVQFDNFNETMAVPSCFRFDNDTQGWTLDQIYKTSTGAKKTPYQGFYLHVDQGRLAATANPLIIDGQSPQSDRYYIILESPDLTTSSSWQNITGYSLDISRVDLSYCGDPPGTYLVQLKMIVIDVTDNSEHIFTESSGSTPVTHSIDQSGQNYHFVWTGSFFSDSKYKMKKIRILLSGAGEKAIECMDNRSWFLDNVCAQAAPSQPSITIREPNGGEKWYVGSQQEVWWESQDFNGPVKIEYSTNNGSSWSTITSSTSNTMFPWTIPDTPSTNCLVRVSDAADGDPYDVSDATFSILKASLTVTSPNGGEVWQVGSTQNITWTSQNIPDNDVLIELSTDNGATYSFIGFKTNNDPSESFSWTVPNSPSTQCLIRLSLDMQGVNVYDVSDAVFEIRSSENTPVGTNVQVDVGNGVTVTFDNVTNSGQTTLTTKTNGAPPPNGFEIIPSNSPIYFDINTTASFTGNVTVCLPYDDAGMAATDEAKLKVFVYETSQNQWKDITVPPVDTVNNLVCGTIDHLTDFAIMSSLTNTVVKIDPASSNMRVGHPDTVDIVIENVENLGGFEFEIAYTGAIVQIAQSADVMLGSFLSSTGRTAFPVGPTIDNNSGSVVFAAASLGSQSGPTGSGVLAKIIWTPLSEGSSVLDLKDVIISDIQGGEIPADALDGEINVTTRFWADIDGDDDVDIIDVQLVAAHWNTSVGDPDYDSIYDVDNNGQGDGDVDIIDVQLVASWWNKPIPPNSFAGDLNVPENRLGKTNQRQEATLRIFVDDTDPAGKGLIIQAEGISDLAGFQFDLVSEQPIAPDINFIVGDFLTDSENEIIELGPEGNSTGTKLTYGNFSLVKDQGAAGNGVLVKISLDNFHATLDFENFILVDSKGQQLKIKTIINEYKSNAGQISLPNDFSLYQNFPNPFNQETYISFEVPVTIKNKILVSLSIYNLNGQLIRTLVNGEKRSGKYKVLWDGKDDSGKVVPSGLYLYKFSADNFKTTRKMLFLK